MANSSQRASAFVGKRAQNTTGAVSILSKAGVLHSINVANSDAAKQTLTVTIDAATSIVLQVPAGDSRSFVFDTQVNTSLTVTPSSANIDAWVSAD